MLKTDALYNLLAYLDECPIGAFKLTDGLKHQFESSVKKLISEAEKEIRANVLNLGKEDELIYLKETLEVLTRYRGWLIPDCWEGLWKNAQGLWADFNDRADDTTKNISRTSNYKFEKFIYKHEEDLALTEYIFENCNEFSQSVYSPAFFRELYLGIPGANLWAHTEEEEEALIELFSHDENSGLYSFEALRQRTLGEALIHIWELVVKMYERRTAQAAPNTFLHEYYTQYCSELSTEAPNRGSGYERFGLPISTTALTVSTDIKLAKNACNCQRQNDAERVEDLCTDCPITAVLNDPLATAHVRAEMRTIKELKLPEQYQSYCAEKLEHHANLAAQLANEMNKPGGWNATKMEVKFYNAAVAKLYREELAPKSPLSAPDSGAHMQSTALAGTVFEIHSYYSKLFEAFSVLPPDDIGRALFEQACEIWADRPWSDFGTFLSRVEAYTNERQISPTRHDKIMAFLAKQKPHYDRCSWLPEERPRIIEADESDLRNRLNGLKAGRVFSDFDTINREDTDAIKQEYIGKRLQEVERRLQILVERHTASIQESTTLKESTKPAKSLKPVSEWAAILTDLSESQLRGVVAEMGLSDIESKPPARAWAGLVLELKKRHYLPEDANIEALVRAFAGWGIIVTPNSIRTPANSAEHWRRKASEAFKTILIRQVL